MNMVGNVNPVLKGLILLETLLFAAVVAGVIYFPAQRASDLRLFELLGAVLASILTTFGLLKMKSLTEN